jgi:hypothetical protein
VSAIEEFSLKKANGKRSIMIHCVSAMTVFLLLCELFEVVCLIRGAIKIFFLICERCQNILPGL